MFLLRTALVSIGCTLALASSTLGQVRSFEGLTPQSYQSVFDDWVPKQYVPTQVKVTIKNGRDYYDLRMEKLAKKVDWAAHHRMTDQSFQDKKKTYAARNLKIMAQQTYAVGGQQYHVAIWQSSPAAPTILWADPSQVPMTGKSGDQLSPFDQLMKSFLAENQIPGATLAVSRKGRLIYAKGFGYCDVDNQSPMQPATLLRIASISKPITAVAVLQLVEQGKLNLDDKVFEILPHPPGTRGSSDPRLADVTVLHCLQHTAGWDRQVSFDPMFRPKTISQQLDVKCPPGPNNIIRYMLQQPLDHPPGSTYAYSNFGYCVLGRVIEQVSGLAYEDQVRAAVLKPLGINDMAIGRTLLENRRSNESVYYVPGNPKRESVVGKIGTPVPRQYGSWHLEAMDSHGGWITSAPDLVKFATAFDNPSNSPLLSAQSIKLMFARPEGALGREQNGKLKSSYYGMGWSVRPVKNRANSWHGGSLDGTSTLLVRRFDGLNWAVLFNQRNCADGKTASSKIDPLLHRAANAVKTWPIN